MTSRTSKILDIHELHGVLEPHRRSGKTIVHCHGVFDLLHPGHFRHLAAARQLGDVLVVTITADDFVGKGPGRPAFTQNLRTEALAGLEAVDYVSVVADSTALPAIQEVRPSLYVKGVEYNEEADDPTGMIREERSLVESFGGVVTYTDDIVFSSSSLINSFMPQHAPKTQSWLSSLREEFGLASVLEWLDRIQEVEVTIVGEAILDVYTECDTLGVASKEPVLCLNRRTSVTHAGGALAIAQHCAGLGARTSLVTGLNSVDFDHGSLHQLRLAGIALDLVPLDPRPTIRKERILDAKTQSRVLELYEMDDTPLDGAGLQALVEALRSRANGSHMVLVADYGHGLLSDEYILQALSNADFLALNAQTNAGNHGFNSVQRYPKADFVTLNGNEVRLEARRRHVDLDAYIPELRSALDAQAILVTQGGAGLELFLANGATVRSPALAPFVADRVGAGDAVLSVTSLLARLGAPAPIIGLLGNIVGAWAVSFLGNEKSLDIGALKRQVSAVLK